MEESLTGSNHDICLDASIALAMSKSPISELENHADSVCRILSEAHSSLSVYSDPSVKGHSLERTPL